MKCPNCGCEDLKVLDSRPVDTDNSIRRRRECPKCLKRFTTFEVIEQSQVIVEKKDGSKELFDRTKLLGGILKATQKRPVDADAIVANIESELSNSMRTHIKSIEIGEMVMNELKRVDDVSYVRFASVYREFKDLDTFLEELKELKEFKK